MSPIIDSFHALVASLRVPQIRSLLGSGALAFAAMPPGIAQTSSTWTGAAADGQWASPANWTAGVPDGADATADFTQLELTANGVIDVGNVTVNRLIFGDTVPGGGNWYLGDPLLSYTFTLAGTDPTVTVGDLGAGFVSFSAGNGPLLLTAASGFIKEGPGQLELAGTNSLGGRIVVRAGTLSAANASALSGAAVVELAGGSLSFGDVAQTFSPELALSATGSLLFKNKSKTIGGPISGPPGVALTLGQSSGNASTISFASDLSVFHGELILASRYYRLDTAFGTTYAASGANAIWTINSGVTGAGSADGGLFFRNGTNAVITFSLGALQGAGILRGGAATGSGTVIYEIGALGLDTTFSGLVRDGASDSTAFTKAGITKVGAGTLTFSGANAYTGPTTVNAGTLVLNGDQTAATGALTVAPGATLRGSGVIGGAVMVNGALAAGAAASPGTLTFQNGLALAITAVTDIRIQAAAHDALALVNPDASGATTRTFAQGGTLRLTVDSDAPLGARTVLSTGANVVRSGAFAAVEALLGSGTLALAPVGGVWLGESGARSYAFDPESGAFSVAATSAFSALQTWRQTHFDTVLAEGDAANDADPDGDGIVNLIEYATGSDPTVASPAPAALGRDLAGHLTLSFAHVNDASLRYVVQASDNLVSWSPIFDRTGDTLDTGGHTTAADPEPLVDHPRRFLRLSVSLLP